MNNVLLVDNDAHQLELLSWEFEDEGYHVSTATDNREALQMLRVEKPDVMVLGLSMEDKNCDTIGQLVNQTHRPAVVIHTARAKS